MKWWNPASWAQAKHNLNEINNIADVFHNLPDFLANRPDEFDEKWFWSFLKQRLPEKYEFYYQVFNEKINEKTE
ncbi:hypothetical protein [Paenibacillus planticolens]|uniref:Uncharacterized protein n=1 Tax=Paenibacillus planticolens TaxID=2654976 RepID=A0ABX1ZQL7_9BACL|nr:hypothetical protein [Paenibacillus planticolens]NOV01192.1 hypothetical protein [Paenibacillus planticolens]